MSLYNPPHPYATEIHTSNEFVTIKKVWANGRISDSIVLHRDVALDLATLLNRELLLDTLGRIS